MSVRCEQPIDELTVQVWSQYHHSNCKYRTLYVNGTALRKNKQTDGRTDKQRDRRSNTRCPGRPFRPGHKMRYSY